MNSYQLISKLRKIRDDTYLTTAAQALYYELVSICNEMKWKEVFKKKNSELCSFLNISEKTLIKSRIDLSDAGLLYFQSTKDKRIGCYYSFTTVISSVYFPDESTDDSTDETQIPPIIDIKTINKEESLAHTHESPPPDKKKSRKEKGDKTPLVYPFTSMAFMSAWEALRKTPKWKKKLNYALQLSLDKLSMFEEEFAIQQIERAIESNWTGVVFTGTERDYQEWLKLKHGNNQKSNQSSECAVKVRTVKL
ncbi:hypothetical protein HMPREF1017_00749 [Bacteroides ovatus 3_8_47FAA]|uniref:hypothetical protein n=1 Tax=Bacteroides ovatus TaxID=28116 RepID=UPI0002132108|nr:hypothetical protein [Bacteroides ovatus]EGN00223.1 hypothetical protein HMPREF1017_00749 [Bacteroides ovatus 3_8_47FAA]QGT70207.1 hypothetical protein FOC41_04175 [Bacteroides ovatus]